MIALRKSKDRGHFDHGWLKTYHTFSFADYYDPKFMSFGPLRVINEDTIEGGSGFPTHGHRDMEIITYVISGAVEHRDSTGSHGIIKPGELQKMTAGSGIRHSEFNHLKDQNTHLLQIWITPDKAGYPPSYDQKDFSANLSSGNTTLLASPTGADGSLSIYQDMKLYGKRFLQQDSWKLKSEGQRIFWLQVVKGKGLVNDIAVTAGDGVAIAEVDALDIHGDKGFEVLLFDMADK